MYTVLTVQYADDASGVDKMNGVNYRSSYDRWRLGFRSTLANFTVSKLVLTNEVWVWTSEKSGRASPFRYCLSPCLPVEGERGAVCIYSV